MKDISHQEQAEMLAIEAIGFVAHDKELLNRFMALTGISAEDVRHAASSPEFLAGVLGFLLSHEPTLLQFCSTHGKAPHTIAEAFSLLPGGGAVEHPMQS